MGKGWIKITALALGLPSGILGLAIAVYHLDKQNILPLGWGMVLLILVVGQTFFLMLRYAKKNK